MLKPRTMGWFYKQNTDTIHWGLEIA